MKPNALRVFAVLLVSTTISGAHIRGEGASIHVDTRISSGRPLVALAKVEGQLAGRLTWTVAKDGVPIDDPEAASFFNVDNDAQRLVLASASPEPGKYVISISGQDAAGTAISAKSAEITVSGNEAPVDAAMPPSPPEQPVPSAPGAASAPTLAFDRLPGDPKAVEDSANVQRFKEALRQRIVDIRLPLRDVNFDDRRLQVADALNKLAADATLAAGDFAKFNAEFGRVIGPIAGKAVVPEDVYPLWRRLFNNDAPALAGEFGIPFGNVGQLQQYYAHVADVLGSDELKDEVFKAQVAKFLAERGYSVAAGAGGSSTPRRGFGRRHKWLHHWRH